MAPLLSNDEIALLETEVATHTGLKQTISESAIDDTTKQTITAIHEGKIRENDEKIDTIRKGLEFNRAIDMVWTLGEIREETRKSIIASLIEAKAKEKGKDARASTIQKNSKENPDFQKVLALKISEIGLHGTESSLATRGRKAKRENLPRHETLGDVFEVGLEEALTYGKQKGFKEKVINIFKWIERSANPESLTEEEMAIPKEQLLLSYSAIGAITHERLDEKYEKMLGNYESGAYGVNWNGDVSIKIKANKLEEYRELVGAMATWEKTELKDETVFARPKSNIQTLGDLIGMGAAGLREKVQSPGFTAEITKFLKLFCHIELS